MKQIKFIVKNYIKVLKLLWNIDRKRVLFEGLVSLLGYIEWIFYSGIFMRIIIGAVEEKKETSYIIIFLCICTIVFLIISLIKQYYIFIIKPKTNIIINKEIYKRIYQQATNVELACYENKDFFEQYVLALDKADENLIDILENMFSIIWGIIAVAISFYIMFRLDKIVILFIFFPFIGNFVFSAMLNKLSYKKYKESIKFKRISDYVTRVVHLKDYAKEIRLTDVFKIMRSKFMEANKRLMKISDKYALKSCILFWLFQYFTFTIMFEGVLLYGAYKTMLKQTMKISELAVLSSVMVSTTWILIGYAEALIKSYKNNYYIQNLFSFLEYVPLIPENQKGIIPNKKISSIEFKNVSFSYSDNKIIDNINYKFNENKIIALVGHNGAGKSTLIKLLLRFYDPTEGEIIVNGINIKLYDLKEYRKLFAVAFQDGQIFSKSIAENVLMDEVLEGANSEKVKKALELTGVWEKVKGFKYRENTILNKEFDEQGEVLSGGESQKILVARALVKERPIKIFDEPSSALDPIAEHTLFKGFMKDAKNSITIFISHRLSSVQGADEIILLQDGKIIDCGNHMELMHKSEIYADLYNKQASNYRAVTKIDNEDTYGIFTKHIYGES